MAEEPAPSQKGPLLQMAVIGTIAAATGVALALLIDWFPDPASAQADDIDTLYDVLLIASVPIFVLVQVVVLFCVWRFRMRPGEELKDGPPIHGNTKLEIAWTAFPAILMVSLCSYAYVVLVDIEEKLPDAMPVTVTGQQFAWTFSYPQSGGDEDGAKPVSSNQLYLPQGRPVYFSIKAKDVIHSFWVPEFRMKQDAVPGITTHTRLTPTKRGTYPLVCAELCGLGHAAMRQSVHVVSPQRFEAWLAERRAPATPTGGSPTEAGKRLFASQEAACGSCHALADADTSGTIGPDLGDSLAGKTEEYIRQGIVAPNAVIARGFGRGIMPGNYEQTLSKEEIDALVSYLAEVTK